MKQQDHKQIYQNISRLKNAACQEYCAKFKENNNKSLHFYQHGRRNILTLVVHFIYFLYHKGRNGFIDSINILQITSDCKVELS